ncbi:MAG: hypothetical protein ACRD8U_24775 [Pyrinomonadaceae bacterium]
MENRLFSSQSSHLSIRDSPILPVARSAWLFSRRVDLLAFLGSAIVSLVALWIGARAGVLNDDSPDWAWVPFVLLIDVAHVYATAFRVYFDPAELKRKPWLYILVPILGYVLGVALYSEGDMLFWRALAYLAVFHFVRQQYGWVALYRARLGERDRFGYWLDTAAIYLATIYPLLYWHAHLPRQFWWFLKNDFAALPAQIVAVLRPIYWVVLGAYAVRSLYRWLVKREGNPGKDIVVVTTAVCWYVGIVAINSDYAFTVTNVVIHGVPYLVLVYWYARAQRETAPPAYKLMARGPVTFLLTLWLLAYLEEMFWDRGLWHERGWLFGPGWSIESFKVWLIPLLALPQLTHYVLDGFIWRRKSNPSFSLVLSPPRQP